MEKDMRAVVEGLVETWKQILEPRMVFLHCRRKYTDLNEKKLHFRHAKLKMLKM